MNTRPLAVTIAPPLLSGLPRRSGSITPDSNGLFLTAPEPSPAGTCHAIVPVFRFTALNVAYGGFTIGRPPSLLGGAGATNMFEYGTSTSGSEPSLAATRTTAVAFDARTNNRPEAASNAAPPQFDPPPVPGRMSVPRRDGGV